MSSLCFQKSLSRKQQWGLNRFSVSEVSCRRERADLELRVRGTSQQKTRMCSYLRKNENVLVYLVSRKRLVAPKQNDR